MGLAVQTLKGIALGSTLMTILPFFIGGQSTKFSRKTSAKSSRILFLNPSKSRELGLLMKSGTQPGDSGGCTVAADSDILSVAAVASEEVLLTRAGKSS